MGIKVIEFDGRGKHRGMAGLRFEFSGNDLKMLREAAKLAGMTVRQYADKRFLGWLLRPL